MAAEVDLPYLGAGITYRDAWRWEVVRHRERLGVIEVIADDFVGPDARDRLHDLRAAVSILLHGVGLSLGSAEGLDPKRIDHLATLVESLRPPWVSEHIAFTRAGGIEIGHLMPLPFTMEAIEVVARNVEMLRAALPDLPILLENIAYTVKLPGVEMDEAAFVNGVIEASGCGLLLDLENVHANALNHGYDPIEYLEALDLDRVVEVHLAGGTWSGDTYADTHSQSVPEESWRLLEWLVPRARVKAVIIERDDELPPFAAMLEEVERASRLLSNHAR